MAAKSGKLHDAIVDRVLECCICNETLKDPRSLPCGHNICLECLEKDVAVRGQNGRYPCPICRREVEVPAGGIKEFGCNILIKNLFEVMKQHEATEPCAYCESHNTAFVCITCVGERMCQECERNHRLHTKAHSIVRLEEFRKGWHDEAVRALQCTNCTRHDNERFRYYCTDCRRLVCMDCINLGDCQNTHRRRTVEDAARMSKESFKDKLVRLDDIATNLGKQNDEVTMNDKVSENALTQHKASIEELYQSLIKKLEDSKNASIEQVEKIYAEGRLRIQESKGRITRLQKSAESLTDQIKRLVQYGTSTETMLLEQALLEELAEIERDLPQEVPQPHITKFRSNSQFVEDLEKLCERFNEALDLPKCVLTINTHVEGDEESSGITGLSVAPDGNIVAVDCANYKVKMYDRTGTLKRVLKDADLKNPWNCLLNQDGSVMVSGNLSRNIVTFDLNGKRCDVQDIGKGALGLTKTSNGNGIVTSKQTHTVQSYSPTGEKQWVVEKNEKGENMFDEPMFVSANSKDQAIVVDRKLNKLCILSKQGDMVAQLQEFGEGGKLSTPQGVCVDGNDHIYVSDSHNDRIIKLKPDGTFQRVVLSNCDGINGPGAITFDSQGRLVVSCTDEPGKPDVINVFKISL